MSSCCESDKVGVGEAHQRQDSAVLSQGRPLATRHRQEHGGDGVMEVDQHLETIYVQYARQSHISRFSQ